MAKQQELIVADKQELAPAAQPETNLLAVIARAAADPQVDVQKMQALLDMQMKIQQKQAEVAFTQAMARLQPKLPRVAKRGQIMLKGQTMSRYALFEDIDKAVRPLLAEEGFAITFGMGDPTENRISVSCTIRHEQGHSVTNTLPLPTDTTGAKSNVQGVGSTITYAKRYLLCMMLNIVMEGEDNDGQNPERINGQQVNKLLDLLDASNANKGAFCKFFGVERIEDIQQGQFAEAVKMLEAKLRKVS